MIVQVALDNCITTMFKMSIAYTFITLTWWCNSEAIVLCWRKVLIVWNTGVKMVCLIILRLWLCVLRNSEELIINFMIVSDCLCMSMSWNRLVWEHWLVAAGHIPAVIICPLISWHKNVSWMKLIDSEFSQRQHLLFHFWHLLSAVLYFMGSWNEPCNLVLIIGDKK